jgi:hypothetical protein
VSTDHRSVDPLAASWETLPVPLSTGTLALLASVLSWSRHEMNSGTENEKEVPDNYIFDLAEFFTKNRAGKPDLAMVKP